MEDILFNEAEHKYYDNNGHIYTSVTTLIHKYAPEYDTEFWCMYTALKEHNLKVRPEPSKRSIYVGPKLFKLSDLMKDSRFKFWYLEIEARWKGINAESCIRGNGVHNELEDSINLSKRDISGNTNKLITPIGKKTIKTQHDLDTTVLKEKYPVVYQRLSGYIERGFSIFAEKKVFLQEYYLAGMIDVPIFKDNWFCILDWKTNKDTLEATAGYYKKIKIQGKWVKTDEWVRTGDKFQYPLDMLEASKIHTYALQLSTYAYILEKWGYKLIPNGLEIIHFPVGQEPRLIKVPYLKQEVEIMLNHHKINYLMAG